MGYGTTRSLERVMASCGLLISAELEFVAADDVPNGGVLCALPALLAEGLLRHTRTFYRLPPGFYPLESIFLALALLALVRCRSLEQSRYLSPGEWGKLLGLDRLPEVKTMRRKISSALRLTTVRQPNGRAAWLGSGWPVPTARAWACSTPTAMCVSIMGASPICHGATWRANGSACGAPPITGSMAWVAQPFFVLTQPVNPGLIAVLRQSIVPRLLAEAPQPDAEALAADPLLPRFTLIFDREGYSPDFFAELKAQRIAILTYHKFPGEQMACHRVRPPLGAAAQWRNRRAGVGRTRHPAQ